MLVLSRKLGERIVMPDIDLTLTVVAIEGNQVRVGITAPSEIGVYREELWHRVAAGGEAAPRRGATRERRA
jgi:carbon storage regulator